MKIEKFGNEFIFKIMEVIVIAKTKHYTFKDPQNPGSFITITDAERKKAITRYKKLKQKNKI